MFEYLMPLLVMRSYPDTLLDESCRMVVRRQMEYAAARGVPWGISESAYNVVDRHDTFQYKAFGVPGLGLKRGLGDELVVAPYATALAAMIDAPQSAANLRRLTARGPRGRLRILRRHRLHRRARPTITTTPPATRTTPAAGTVVRTYLAHHAGMTLVALANALLGDPMVKRFHADPRVQATELLLQERVPRHTPTIQPRPLDEMRVVAPPPAMPMRRFRSPHTVFPHAQFLSNGNYVTVVTNAGGGSSFCRGLAVTKSRRDPTRDPGSQFVYLRDVRSGSVWSATYHPTAAEPDDYVVEFRAERATFRRHDDEISTQLDVAVSTEDDVEVRRVTVVNQSTRIREIDVTSYAEIVLAPPGRRSRASGLRQTVSRNGIPGRQRGAALPSARPRSPGAGRVGGARPEPRRPAAGARRMGDRSRTIPRPRPGHRRPGRARRARAVGHDGHRARPDLQPPPADQAGPGGVGAPLFRHRHRLGSRDGRGARPEVPRPERGLTHLRARLHARAERPAPSGHFERRGAAVRTSRVAGALRRRLAAGEPGHDRVERARSGRPVAARHFRRSARSCSCASSATTMWRSCVRCCRRRSTGA